METINQTLSSVDTVLKEVIANPYVSATLTIFFIVYAGLAAPKLPPVIANLFNYTLFRILILFGILIVNRYNSTVAIIVAIAFFISLQTLSRVRLNSFMEQVSSYKRTLLNQKEETPTPSDQTDEDGNTATPTDEQPTEQVQMVAVESDIVEDSEVSGLAHRAAEFESPQGLGGLHGYDGNIVGAEFTN